MSDNLLVPNHDEEDLLFGQGYQYIAGVDEVGRGCLAGPLVAAAVIMPAGINTGRAGEIRDSKQLKFMQRRRLGLWVRRVAVSVGIGMASHEEIDELGIAPATRLAMKLAVEQLQPCPEYVLIDYFKLPEVDLPQKGVADGDSLCFSIACASIVAKDYRDKLMRQLDRTYNGYGFSRHKGYATREHVESINRMGICAIHRRSFLKKIIVREDEA